jgi:hypothetical protein
MLRLGKAVVAGTAYAIALFLLGSALGVVRVLVLEPPIGRLDATVLELPLILGFAWLVSGSVIQQAEIPPRAPDRLLMGGLALLLLLGAEFAIAALLWRSPDYSEPAALLGLAGQVIAALLPLLQARRFTRRTRALP